MSKITELVKAALPARVLSLESGRGVANGIATLDSGGNVPLSQLGNVPGGGGGSSNAGDRASLTLAAFDSGAFLFPLAFADPQPSGGAVPDGWTIVDDMLSLPVGVYWVVAHVSATATAPGGQFQIEVNFLAEWNGADVWRAVDEPFLTAGDGETTNPSAHGIVSTAAPDTLIVTAARSGIDTATFLGGSLFVTRIA